MARRVAREEGILIGGSGGLAVAAAMKLGAELGPDDLVVVLIPDSGRGYLSKVFNDDWLAGFGFLRECDLCVGAVLDARGPEVPPLVYVNPDDRARDAIDKMHAHGISQLPVCKNEPPFAAAEVSGAVDELELMDAAFRDAVASWTRRSRRSWARSCPRSASASRCRWPSRCSTATRPCSCCPAGARCRC